VQYYSKANVEYALQYINGTCLDDQVICIDWVASFKMGRQYECGQSGVRYNTSTDRTMMLTEETVENWHTTSEW
jgi:hypothetical protein